MKVVGVIASRYDSTRLPGKALKDICGRPMVWWVYQSVLNAKKLDEIYVATDDERIKTVCEQNNIPVIMTRKDHREAANRLQEVSQTISADFYVQINGDEPLLNAEHIDAAIPADIPQDEEYGTNLMTKITNPVQALDASNIKVVFDENNYATYFSRTPIPYPYRSIEYDFYKHVGVIGYNKKMLDFYATNPPGRFEKIEAIATLRFTDYGKKLLCIEVEDTDSLSVDTQMDLEYVRKVIDNKLKQGELEHYRVLLDQR
ncbi:3-deoxy-manno-octulosonate cytidylyltransferase [Butyrivibrio sp. AC2005]|uniref:3-deoxy-manno-octulosonate cytidylyltransferase n=1 Tax=Butyrivibrio sp. AC2005 TaxID=1280672 RepID=UPI0003FABEAC|nr:3-deoxy-manno-octulosonate cytidylyltransferase [Butyrivibrio sp. AC2005]